MQNRRELQIVDNIIGNMGVLGELCSEVIDECLLEGVEQYVVENMF